LLFATSAVVIRRLSLSVCWLIATVVICCWCCQILAVGATVLLLLLVLPYCCYWQPHCRCC
jgi:hypothetical protein